jgi:hypothetical protein
MLMEFAREQTWSGVEVDDGASLVLLQRWGQIADDIVYTWLIRQSRWTRISHIDLPHSFSLITSTRGCENCRDRREAPFG